MLNWFNEKEFSKREEVLIYALWFVVIFAFVIWSV